MESGTKHTADHYVQPETTLWQVSRKYGVRRKTISDWTKVFGILIILILTCWGICPKFGLIVLLEVDYIFDAPI